MVGHCCVTKIIVTVCNDLVSFEMGPLKTDTRSVSTRCQFLSSKHFVCQVGSKLELVCCQFLIECNELELLTFIV